GSALGGGRLLRDGRPPKREVPGQGGVPSGPPGVGTVGPGAVKAVGPARGTMTVTEVPVTLDPAAIRETFVRLERPGVQDIDLSTADIIVSAGRGIQKKENLALVEEFAKAIGGGVGASRPLTDMD